MGVVNNYINRIIKYLKKEKSEQEYEHPWHQYYGDIPEHLNYPHGSMYDALRETALMNESKTAYIYFKNKGTYGDFLATIDQIAEALTQFDITENESVTVCMPNTPESFALIYAINKIGAIANVVHPLSSTADIERALSETNSDTIFCSDAAMPKARKIKVKNFVMVPTNNSFKPMLKVLYGIKEKENLKVDEGMLTWDEFLMHTTDKDVYVKRSAKDPAAILYSGGTTGKPKGIILSNGNFNAMALETRTICDIVRPGNTVMSALPIFHVFGLAICCHTVMCGGMTCHIIPRVDTKNMNKELKKYHPSIFPAVPSMLRLCLKDKDPGFNALKDIKIVVVGGDYLPPDLKKDFEQFLRDHGSDAVVKIGYGLSECCGFACSTAPIDEKDSINGTLGVPNPDIDIKIFEVGKDIEKTPGEIGEICVNGPTVMMGYINEDEETAKTLVLHNDGKIWLHTGDLGSMDETGRIFYSSRLKRMIITNGYNVYPIELEDIIAKCPLVSSCTVVGVPHKTKGQTPKAVIVLKDGVEEDLDTKTEIRKYCKANLAAYAVPTEYEFRKNMPVTAVGKVAYRELENNEDAKDKKDKKEKNETKR